MIRPHTADLALLEHPEQHGLEARREVRHLVEEEGAPPGGLDGPGAVPVCVREGALGVPEEFGLQDPLCKGGTIHRDQGAGAAGSPMHLLGCQFLAAPRRAQDEHRQVRVRHPVEFAQDGGHGFTAIGEKRARVDGRCGGSSRTDPGQPRGDEQWLQRFQRRCLRSGPQQHRPHGTALPDQGMPSPEPLAMQKGRQGTVPGQAAEGTLRWRRPGAQGMKPAFLLPGDPGGCVPPGQPILEQQGRRRVLVRPGLGPEGSEAALMARRGRPVRDGLEVEQPSGRALAGQALEDLQSQFEAHDLGRAVPPGGPEGLRISGAPEQPVGLPADAGFWISRGWRRFGQGTQGGLEKAGVGVVPHPGEPLPDQVPVLTIHAVGRQESPGRRKLREGLHQVPDAGQRLVGLEVHLGQLGRLKRVPGRGEGSPEGRPTAMGGEIGPLEGHEGGVGGGSRRPARGPQPEEVGVGQGEGPQGGSGLAGLAGRLALGHPMEGVCAGVGWASPGGIALDGFGRIATPAHPEPIPGGVARGRRRARSMQVLPQVCPQGSSPARRVAGRQAQVQDGGEGRVRGVA